MKARAFGFDRAGAAFLMGAEDGQTMSQMIGLAARRGAWWGLLGSAFLSWAVEPDHCEKALSGGDGATSGRALVMSGVLLFVLFQALAWSCWFLCSIFLRVI